ncbi:ATP-binding protein [Embleya sp. NPDC059237]|uniref:ATP-binding protein n=1 Tax=Embleya sp. NPDC059237 TaxID=3346784 RepID=UPI0036837426
MNTTSWDLRNVVSGRYRPHRTRAGLREPRPALFLHVRIRIGIDNACSAVGASRNVVTTTLETWGAGEDVRDWAALVVSELVTNAIAHTPCRSVAVGVLVRRSGEVLVVVADNGPGPLRIPTDTDPGDFDDEHGRGLFLVATTSTRFGATRRLGHTVVWAGHDDTPSGPPTRARPRRCRVPRIGRRRTRGRTGGDRP